MTNDRRVRLRPKTGAQALYYGGTSGAGATGTRSSLLDQALGNTPSTLPWLSNRPLATDSPTTPNFVSSSEGDGGLIPIFNQSQINQPSLSEITPTGFATQAQIDASNANSTFGGLVNGALPSLSSITNALPSTSSVINSISGISSVSSVIPGISSFVNSLFGSANGAIMAPLAQTNGLVFPFTPTIDVNQSVDYSSYDAVHTNQEFMAYTRTKAPVINITGKFTAQNQTEAQYALAAVHFCRVSNKMSFGSGSNLGTPPPILLFSAYGEYAFQDLPVIVTGFNTTWPEDVDYIKVPNSTTWVPAIFSITLNLTVQNSPAKMRAFNLDQFRSGAQVKQGYI